MNERVRSYLIEAARQKDKFVFYSDVVNDCDLGFDLSTEYGQNQLSETLGDVSTFENENKRPLISSLAIYKDARRNDHGDGFYRIAEILGKGKFKKLRDDLYGFAEAEECRRFWQNENNYRQFAKLNGSAPKKEFFTRDELEFFKKWQYKAYDKKNPEHIQAKNTLMDTVWEKTIYLGNQIVGRLNGFSLDGKKIWHQRGWKEEDGENVQAAIFKPYTWIKIFRKEDTGKEIFFTFGIDAYPSAEAFIFKIDCQSERDSKLTQPQIDLCKSLIPTSAKWNTILFQDLLKLNWESLTATCIDFINQYQSHYDAIIAAVWGGAAVSPHLFKNTLVWREKPKDGFDEMPGGKRTFKGVDIDFQARGKEQSDLGDAGEGLVMKEEIKFLNSIGLTNQAAQVRIAKPGEGFDVLSFDELGNKKFIEVKTTTGNEYFPFYLSENEIEFMRLNQNQYCIYRVYHYDAENNFGECFEIIGDVDSQLIKKPTQYKVVIKKETT